MSNFDTIIQSEKPVLVDFFATWCGPCKMLSPILREVKDSLGDTVSIIKIDVDKNQQISSKYQVRGVPTMILFQNGKQLWRQSGVLTKEEIIKTIIEKSFWKAIRPLEIGFVLRITIWKLRPLLALLPIFKINLLVRKTNGNCTYSYLSKPHGKSTPI